MLPPHSSPQFQISLPPVPGLAAPYAPLPLAQDKYGRPVYIELLGVTDCVKMLQVSPMEQILKWVLQSCNVGQWLGTCR